VLRHNITPVEVTQQRDLGAVVDELVEHVSGYTIGADSWKDEPSPRWRIDQHPETVASGTPRR
jgi:hypothetical protein